MAKANSERLKNYLKEIQKAIKLFPSQGHTDVYFTAYFFSGNKKQNSIERGEVSTVSKQLRTHIDSEEADTVKLTFTEFSTGKTIYSKQLTNLRGKGDVENSTGNGLGEAQVNALVEKKVYDIRRDDQFQQMSSELEELRKSKKEMEKEMAEMSDSLEAKKNIEYYMGLVNLAVPGLAQLFTGTRLAQAASFLAGTGDKKAEDEGGDEDAESLGNMIHDFCKKLSPQNKNIAHVLFTIFEKDPNQMQQALTLLSTNRQEPIKTNEKLQ